MSASLSKEFVERAREALEEEGLDGWLLFDLEGRNRVAAEILGLPEGTSRRHFVLIPREGRPVALAHRVEGQKWEGWEHELRPYVGWEEMEAELRSMLDQTDWIAMEISEADAVPFVDYVPAGVVGLIESMDVRVVSSAGLVSRAYARWSETGLRTHRRAARELARIAREAFDAAAEGVRSGSPLTEREVADRVLAAQEAAGLGGGGVIIAGGPDTALPHFEPAESGSRRLARGEVFLVDLWGRVQGEPDAVFADQTWMGVLDEGLPEGFGAAWEAVAAARDGVVAFLAEHAGRDEPPTGADADRAARSVLIERGYGEALLHRTGHGMDRVNHGFGPNLDSVETRDERALIPGVGFSIEPGVYLEGRWGIRSEINVYMGEDGPEVSPDAPQVRPWTLDG